MAYRAPRDCHCKSGLLDYPVTDARGIFITYACKKCEEEKTSGYRKDIMENPNYWAEEDIEPEEVY